MKKNNNNNKNQQDFKENNNIEFSVPVDGYITKHALVETLMEGVPISKFMGQEIDSSLKNKLSLLCCDLLLQMVFVNNFVHGMYIYFYCIFFAFFFNQYNH